MKIKLALILGVAFFNLFATDTVETNIKSRLMKMFPDAKITDVTLTPVPGIYEVSAGSFVIYVTQDTKYLFQGDLIELKDEQINLSEKKRQTLRVTQLKNIKTESTITFAAQNPHTEVYVFTDVECGYCRQLHKHLDDYAQKGITVHYLAFPRQGKNSEVAKKMQAVWCAADRKQAFTDSINGKAVNLAADCQSPIAAQFDLGVELGVSGTPAFILPDGTLLPGLVPADALLNIINNKKLPHEK